MILSFYNWFVRGGIIMFPILIFSIIAVALIIERFLLLKKIQKNSATFSEKMEILLKEKNFEKVKNLAVSSPGPLARMIRVGIESHIKNTSLVKNKIHEVALKEVPLLEKHLSLIGTIATIEPMLGLLGTVTGMIRAFTVIALKGTGNPQALAGGISEALITTEAGLIVAIPLVYLHNILSEKVQNIISNMEQGAINFLNTIEETKHV
jgi:biopolymer transport protein ExbB